MTRILSSVTFAIAITSTAIALGKAPAVGEKAPEFALKDVEGKEVKLSDVIKHGPAVLIVLRGYPGYQCPVCNAQAGEFLAQAKKFESAKAQVVFVYPGPGDGLTEKAREFLKGKSLPAGFQFLVDPDYTFTNAYALRWDKPKETAYPATFVIDPQGVVRFALISTSHGGRSKAADVLATLGKL